MDWVGTVSGISATAIAIGGFILTWRRASADRKSGISSAENEGRRDTISDRDSLIQTLISEVERGRKEIEQEKNMRSVQASSFDSRITTLEEELISERMYTNDLIAHIWMRKPPPPPDRRKPIEITA